MGAIKSQAFNEIMMGLQTIFFRTYSVNPELLGNASIFMNKVFFEWTLWFNNILPLCKLITHSFPASLRFIQLSVLISSSLPINIFINIPSF